MTVSSTTRKAGPFTGNGSQTVFPFTFKVFTKYDIEVVSADTSGTETTLVVDSDYTVFLNADQDNSPGGTITLSAALASGYLLVVVGDLEFSQDTDLPTGGAFNATNVENALDRLTMLCQQLRELTTRAVSVGPTSSVSGDQLLVEINQAVVDSAASAASALLSLNTFKSQYYGVLAADPTLDPLGNPMTQGDLYFSSALLRMRAYSGSAWADVGVATPVTINTQRFSGTGAQTVFTLTNAPAFQNAADVFVGGVPQVPGVNFTITGAGLTTLTFLTGAPPAGTNNIFVKTANAYAGGVPNEGSVTPEKLSTGAPVWDGSGNLYLNGVLSVVSNAASYGLTVSSTAAGGANLKITGTSGSPSAPNKTLRSLNGFFEIINSAYTRPILSVSDTGDLYVDCGYGSAAKSYGCRAWVNFDGTGTVAIRGSGNVSSITDNGVGDYTVNFATAMVDANYGFSVASGSQVNSSGYSYTSIYPNTAPTTSSLRVSIPGVVSDTLYNSVQIFR